MRLPSRLTSRSGQRIGASWLARCSGISSGPGDHTHSWSVAGILSWASIAARSARPSASRARPRTPSPELLLGLGIACSDYQDGALRNLTCERVQVDEIWSFVGCKKADPISRQIHRFQALLNRFRESPYQFPVPQKLQTELQQLQQHP